MDLPKDFIEYTSKLMGKGLWDKLENGLSEEAPVSIRLNPFKCKEDAQIPLQDSIVPWCSSTGRYLKKRPNFTFDPLLHAGVYYVQEAASMFLDTVLRKYVKEPVLMLDLCAAPGGKSTCARAALPEGSLLFSNEPMRTRANILAENMQKFGHEDVIVTNNYPHDYKKSKFAFDVILTDVPCSGEGMFRKDPNAINEWSLQNVDKCRNLQREIVSDIWPCLKPDGILIYSTCTFNAHEDEENVAWIINELGADLLPIEDKDMHHFYPGITRSEGLFMAVLRKTGEDANTGIKCKNVKIKSAKVDRSWIKDPDGMDFIQQDEKIIAIPKPWSAMYNEANRCLNILSAGIMITDNKHLIPNQSMALSRKLNKEAFSVVELTYEQAISYLRTEAITLSSETPKGITLLTYHGTPIGFAKNLGSRANNLYPQEWKIKSTHIPSENDVIINN